MSVRGRLRRGDDPRGRAAIESSAVVAELGGDAQVGFHGHDNLGIAVANSVHRGARRRGADRRLGSRLRGRRRQHAERGVRRGCDRLGISTGIDVLALMDAAEEVVRPVMDQECIIDRLALVMGYAGVYSSFLRHAYRPPSSTASAAPTC